MLRDPHADAQRIIDRTLREWSEGKQGGSQGGGL